MERNIAYENGSFWVLKKSKGHYEVCKLNGTHSVKVATIHFQDKPDYALSRAIAECDRRAAL